MKEGAVPSRDVVDVNISKARTLSYTGHTTTYDAMLDDSAL